MIANKTFRAFSRAALSVFHPLLIPSIGFLLLFHSSLYFIILPWSIKKYILLVVFFSTCVLPLIGMLTVSLTRKYELSMGRNTDRVLILLLCAASYFVGYQLLRRFPIYPIYNMLLIGAIFAQVSLLPLSMRWNICLYSAAIGGLFGGLLGLSFRLHENPVFLLVFVILIAGFIGSLRLALHKNTDAQVYTGFLVGFFSLLFILSVF